MDDSRDDEEEDEAEGPRVWRIVWRGAVLVAGVVAAVELLASEWASRWELLALAGAVALVVVPAIALLAAVRDWQGWKQVLWLATWLAAGAAVLVATSAPPLSHVEGMQTGGLIAVATVMLVLPVVRGGYNPGRLAELGSLGSMFDRFDRDR